MNVSIMLLSGPVIGPALFPRLALKMRRTNVRTYANDGGQNQNRSSDKLHLAISHDGLLRVCRCSSPVVLSKPQWGRHQQGFDP
jgi:hypothetical protein